MRKFLPAKVSLLFFFFTFYFSLLRCEQTVSKQAVIIYKDMFYFVLKLDLIGTSSYDIIHPDDHKEFQELLCSAFQTDYNDYMNNLDDFDGRYFFT